MITLKIHRLFFQTTKTFSFRYMSTISIKSGISDQFSLPSSQVVIVGTKPHLKSLQLEKSLATKLNGIDEKLFKAALDLQSKSVPLYLNLAKVIALPTEASRHNSPSNANTLFNELKSFPIADGIKSLSIVLYSPYEHLFAHISAIARSFPFYSRKTAKKPSSSLEEIQIEIEVTDGKQPNEKDIKFLQNLSEHIRICGQQVDAPCNELHSEAFANEAVKMVENLGVPVQKTVIVGEKLKEEGFGGIYHVGKAAANPPVFACFSYTPEGAKENIALVGKGIVYDTGGMQIKPAASMVGMKSDMAGAAGLLGAFCTLVKNGFKQNLHCLLCIAENSISPIANKPDDIITMLSGKTVEIAHTDAEGRLVLADGVYYAKTKLNANIIIDMATLTGAQAYATGKLHAGILSNSQKWESKSVKAGRASGDLCHPFVYAPDLHFKDFDSKMADIKNLHSESTSVGAPSSTAGLFIGSHILDFGAEKEKDLSWLHFDIAYPAKSGERATGYGVALVSRLLGDYTDVEIANSKL